MPGTSAAAAREVLPAAERVRLAVEEELDAVALDDAADDGVVCSSSVDRREQLVVLAEAEVIDRRALGERDAVEVDHAAHPRATRELARVDGDPVGDVEHRVRGRPQAPALAEAQRGPQVGGAPERRARAAERARDDEQVTGPRARPPRDTRRPPDRGD